MATLTLTPVNNTGAQGTLYYAIIGLNTNSDWVYVNSDGSTTTFSATTTSADYSLNVTANVTVTIPVLNSGQIYFSVGTEIIIGTNTNPTTNAVALVLPSGWTPNDPNYLIQYDFVEFSFDGTTLNCDLTQVDAFGLPITMTVVGSTAAGSPTTQTTGGWSKSMSDIFTIFQANTLLSPLVITSGGINYRIISPGHGIDNSVFPSNYLDSSIAASWSTYNSTNPLAINIGGGAYAGNYQGIVSSSANQPMNITLNSTQIGSIGYPSTLESFYCNGVFDQGNTAMGAVANIIATAINRGILQTNPQPDCTVSDFYPSSQKYNSYAQLLHTLALNGLCYGFAYDDQCNQSSDISITNPTSWNITIASLT